MKNKSTNNSTDAYIEVLKDLNNLVKKYDSNDDYQIVAYILEFIITMLVTGNQEMVEKILITIEDVYKSLEEDKYRES